MPFGVQARAASQATVAVAASERSRGLGSTPLPPPPGLQAFSFSGLLLLFPPSWLLGGLRDLGGAPTAPCLPVPEAPTIPGSRTRSVGAWAREGGREAGLG